MATRPKTIGNKKPAARPAASASPVAPAGWGKSAPAALDSLRANVFVADPDLKIVYINPCAVQTLRSLADEIRGAFNVEVEDILVLRSIPSIGMHAASRSCSPIPRPCPIRPSSRLAPQHSKRGSTASTAATARSPAISWPGRILPIASGWNWTLPARLPPFRRSQAVVEFELDGTISAANDIFLKTVGYTLDEIKGRHHSLFVDEAARMSSEYRDLWLGLNRGESQTGEFRRFGKGGREIYLQGVYSPIVDKQGRPFKVVRICHRRHRDQTAERRLSRSGRCDQPRAGGH